MTTQYYLFGFENDNNELYGKFISMDFAKGHAEVLAKAGVCEHFEIKIIVE